MKNKTNRNRQMFCPGVHYGKFSCTLCIYLQKFCVFCLFTRVYLQYFCISTQLYWRLVQPIKLKKFVIQCKKIAIENLFFKTFTKKLQIRQFKNPQHICNPVQIKCIKNIFLHISAKELQLHTYHPCVKIFCRLRDSNPQSLTLA